MKKHLILLFIIYPLIIPKATPQLTTQKVSPQNKINKSYQLQFQRYITQSIIKKSGEKLLTIEKEIFDEKTWQIEYIAKNEYQVELIQNKYYWRNKENSDKWRTIDDNYSYLPGEKNILLHKLINVRVLRNAVELKTNDEFLSTSKAYKDNITQLKQILEIYLLRQKAIPENKFTLNTRKKDGSIKYTPLNNYNTTYSPLSFFILEDKTDLGSDYNSFYEKDESFHQKEYSYKLNDSIDITYAIHSKTKENLKTIITQNEPYVVTYKNENNEQRDTIFTKTNTVLKGHIENFIPNLPISLEYIEKLPGKYNKKAFICYPDKEGNFNFKIYLNKPIEFAFKYKEVTPFIMSPGDMLCMTTDMKTFDEAIKWTGKGSEKNQFLADRFLFEETLNLGDRALFQQTREQYCKLDPEQFKSFCDSISQIKYGFIQEYFPKLDPVDYLSFYYEAYLNNYLEKTGYDRKQQYYRKKENKKPFSIDYSYYDFKDNFHADNDLMSFAKNYETSIRGIVFFDIMYEIQNKYAITYESLAQHYENRLMFSKLFFSGITEYTLAYITLGDIIQHSTWEQAKHMMVNFAREYPDTPYFKSLLTIYAKAVTVSPGQPAYDFQLEDLNGNLVKLSNYKGKVVYIDFWETTSRPCLQQIENYAMKLEDKMKGKEIVFMYIACEGDANRVKSYLNRNNIDGVLLITKNQDSLIKDKYWFSGFPHYYIIDKEGKIVQRDAERPSELLNNPISLLDAL